jgi:glycosyltransferase 2 family protein
MKLLRALLLVVGLAFLCILVVTNEPATIFAAVTGLSWRLAVVAVFPFVVVTTFDTLGWKYAFLSDRVGFRTLMAIRIAGEAFNLTTPTASVGGEAIKAWLLRRHVSLDEAVLSVVVAKTTITLAQGVFLLLGIVTAWMAGLPDSSLLHGMMWLLALEVLALVGFVAAQMRGVFGPVQRWLARVGVGLSRHTETGARVDRGLLRFYREEPRRLTLSIAFHFVAWLLGVVEVVLVLRFLGVPVSLTTATIIEAFGTAVRFATFLVPASVGAQEGGYVVTFVALGLPASTAVAFGLTRRVREIVWIIVGLVIFALMRSEVRPASALE